MPPTVDYLPVATGGGANVDTQANFAGSGYQTQGFTSGLAQSKQLNKVWRQASMMISALANFIANTLNINVLDDGNSAALLANLTSALRNTGIAQVAFSATPTFDASLGKTFEITLTGNVTSSTLANAVNGDVLRFIIHQDGAGGHTFAWPASVPGPVVDPGVNAVSVVSFIVDGSGVLHPYTPMTVS